MPRPEPEDIAFFLCFAVIFMVAQVFGWLVDDWNPDCTDDSPSPPCHGKEEPSGSLTTRGSTLIISGVLLGLWLWIAIKVGRKMGLFPLGFLVLYLVGVWVAKISVARGDDTAGGKPQCNALLPQSKLFTDGPHMTYKIFIYLIMIYLLLQFLKNPDRRLFVALLFVFPVIILVNEAVAWIIGLNIDEKGASGKSIDIVELYKNYILGPGKDGTYGDSAEDDRGVWWIAEGPKLLLRLALVGALIYGARKLTSPWSAAPMRAVLSCSPSVGESAVGWGGTLRSSWGHVGTCRGLLIAISPVSPHTACFASGSCRSRTFCGSSAQMRLGCSRSRM